MFPVRPTPAALLSDAFFTIRCMDWHWPEPPSRPEPWLTGDVDVPPTLTISVTADPATPHQGGINLARALGGSLLTVDGAQHGVALFGQSRCVDRTVSDYLIDLRTPPADARCTIGD